MKFEDIQDYLYLRGKVRNAWEVVRFRKTASKEDQLVVDYVDEPPLFIRGTTNDWHMFHRINLRDEYRLDQAKGWQCVVDIGGNAGFFAARASKIAKRVITCEPVSYHFERLTMNCAERHNIESLPMAIAAEPGRKKIYRPRLMNMTGVHSLYRDMGGHMTDEYDEVDAITVNELFQRCTVDRCDLLKLDVEGAEYEILHSASKETLEKIKRIHGEYHNVQPQDPRTRIAHFQDFLKSKGYRVEIVPHRKKANHGTFFATRP